MQKDADPRRALLRTLNAQRRAAGAPPLEYLEEQSRAADAAIPQIFGATMHSDPDPGAVTSELSAGRFVRGDIRWGITEYGVATDGNMADWLAMRLQSPHGRKDLLDPFATHAAIGVSEDPSIGCTAVVTTYVLFRGSVDPELADGLYDFVARRREQRSTARAKAPRELLDAAEEVASRRATPEAALRAALVRVNAHSERYLTGVVIDISGSMEGYRLPDELGEPDALSVAVVVTHWKKPDEPWARSIGFVLFETEPPEPESKL